MENDFRLERTPIILELVPVLIQIAGIVTLLFLTRGNSTNSVFAIIVSLIWLNVTHSDMPQEYGKLRVARTLFSKIGQWLNHEDANSAFDDAQEKYLKMDGSLEDDKYKAVTTASGIANSIRSFASVLGYGYLIFVILMYWLY